MSRKRRSESMVGALFTATQQRVLGLLFGQPDRSYYATELIGLARVGSGAVQRELARLTRSGLITVRAVGAQKHYQANPHSPLFAELCGIAQKTTGLAEPLRESLQALAPEIRAAFVYGSVAKQQDTAGQRHRRDADQRYADLWRCISGAGDRERSARKNRKPDHPVCAGTPQAREIG